MGPPHMSCLPLLIIGHVMSRYQKLTFQHCYVNGQPGCGQVDHIVFKKKKKKKTQLLNWHKKIIVSKSNFYKTSLNIFQFTYKITILAQNFLGFVDYYLRKILFLSFLARNWFFFHGIKSWVLFIKWKITYHQPSIYTYNFLFLYSSVHMYGSLIWSTTFLPTTTNKFN